MKTNEVMLVCIMVTNTLAIMLILGKIKQMEKKKSDTLYDFLYQLVYPIMGWGFGTILAYLIKFGY